MTVIKRLNLKQSDDKSGHIELRIDSDKEIVMSVNQHNIDIYFTLSLEQLTELAKMLHLSPSEKKRNKRLVTI